MRRPLPQPDFLHPVARPGGLAWAWCATGLLVLAATALDSQAVWQQRALALARQARSARLPATPAPASPAPASAAQAVAAAARPDLLARRAEARRWLQQLARPWPAVWAASGAAAPGVRWLALGHGSSAGLRLAGLAPDLAAVQATAQALRGQQQQGQAVWQGVLLASVERLPDGQRFELVARLAEPAAGLPTVTVAAAAAP